MSEPGTLTRHQMAHIVGQLRHESRPRPIPPRLKAALIASCSHHFDAPIEFTDWRWHVIARNLGLASIQ